MDESQSPLKALPNLQRFLARSELAYKGVRFDVRACDLPTASGQTHRHEAVVHPGACVILPLLEHDEIIMIRNYRFAVGEILWELPAGTLEPNESPLDTALRELTEETGYQASQIEPLTVFYSSPGINNEAIYAYLAKDLTFVGQKLDDTEEITTQIVSWPKALSMIQEGEIRDAKTMLTLLFYARFRCNH